MKVKQLKWISFLFGMLMGAFVAPQISEHIENISDYTSKTFLPQVLFALALICLLALYGVILRTIRKRGVFIRKNERILRYFGLAILILSITSNLLFKYLTDTPHHAGSSMLAVLGGTLIFLSFIFKIGIKMQEEQELTV